MKKLTCILLITSVLLGGTSINTYASEDNQIYCVINDEGETICFDEENNPIDTYEHNNCPN